MDPVIVSPTEKREKWIDTAKAIAIICIILGHVSAGLEGWFNFQFVYGFHVTVFFILSGYTFKKGPLTADYLNRKFRRLMTPYFITCFAVIVLDVLYLIFITKDRSVLGITESVGSDLLRTFYASGSNTEIVTGMDMGCRIGAIWFLPALFFVILLFRFLSDKIQNNKLLGLICGAGALIGYVTARIVWLPFSIQSALFALFFFWAGYTIRKNDLLSKIRWYFYPVALVCFLAGIWLDYCSLNFVTANAKDLLLSPVVSFAACLLVYLLAKAISRLRLFNWIGRESLTILCVHLIALETMPFGRVIRFLKLEGQVGVWAEILLHLLFAIIGTFLIIQIRRKLYQPLKQRFLAHEEKKAAVKRDPVIDIERGLLIIAMLVGHLEIDPVLRNIIYSCHMIAFVFLSGYFYKKTEHFGKSLVHLMKAFLVPYLVNMVITVLLDIPNWSGMYFLEVLKKYVLGMSFSERLFPDAASVGPVYFILMLFVVRVLYMLIDKWIRSEAWKWAAVLVCTVLGIGLGHFGLWLPWSIDVALYCLLFYKIGLAFKQYRLLEFVRNHHWTYFILSLVWAYMIYRGGMEIAIRNYGERNLYGLVIAGAVCGTLVIYRLSAYIAEAMPFTGRFLQLTGEASIILIVVHVAGGGVIRSFLDLFLNRGGVLYAAVSILLQILIALLVYQLKQVIKRTRRIRKNRI